MNKHAFKQKCLDQCTKFKSWINKAKFLDFEIKWSILNFVFILLVLIVAIACIVTTSNTSNKIVTTGLVYGAYLPVAITSIIFSLILTISSFKVNGDKCFKTWFFYMPLISIFIEAIILPIPLNLITTQSINTGMLWSILIFAFMNLLAGILSFISIYKVNLTSLTYVVEEKDDNETKSTTSIDTQTT